MLPIKASCAMKGDRSSRVTRSGLSKSAERIRSGDEFPKTALCGSGPAILHIEIIASRDDPPLTASVQDRQRTYWIAWSLSLLAMAVGGSSRANLRSQQALPWRSSGRRARAPLPKQMQQ